MSLQTVTQASIEKIATVKEAVEVNGVAEAAAIFYKAQGDMVASQDAKRISLRSARRAGQILENVERKTPGRPKNSSLEGRIMTPYQEALDGAGISRHIANTWQKLAEIPDKYFEEYLADPKHLWTEFTIKGIFDFVRPFFKEQASRAQARRAAKFEALEFGDFKINDVYVADVNTITFPENSVDMIFTDPPYHDEYLDLYKALTDFADHTLKPGAYLMTYCGKMFLPAIHKLMGDKLEYVWEFGVFQPDNNTKIMKHHLFEAWRPILCYKKPGKTAVRDWQPDMIKGTRDKSFHEWQQQIEPPIKYIGAYTRPGDLIVDPFVGGGTTIKACKELGRDYIGFDKDVQAVKMTKLRLSE